METDREFARFWAEMANETLAAARLVKDPSVRLEMLLRAVRYLLAQRAAVGEHEGEDDCHNPAGAARC